MARFFHPLVLLLARCTDNEMAQMVEYLKAENRILRSKLPKRVSLTSGERQRLVTRGKALGKKIEGLITLVTPSPSDLSPMQAASAAGLPVQQDQRAGRDGQQGEDPAAPGKLDV
jgi:hypothetical protein